MILFSFKIIIIWWSITKFDNEFGYFLLYLRFLIFSINLLCFNSNFSFNILNSLILWWLSLYSKILLLLFFLFIAFLIKMINLLLFLDLIVLRLYISVGYWLGMILWNRQHLIFQRSNYRCLFCVYLSDYLLVIYNYILL